MMFEILLSCICLCLLFVQSVFAANICVDPTATGNGLGGDWNNVAQWSSLSPVRGNTYYLQDGTYAAKTRSTALSGSTVITIKKAISTDHATDTGWLSTMGDGPAVINSPLIIQTGYWTINGQTRNESDWFVGTAYGIKIAVNGSEQQIIIRYVTADSNQFYYVYAEALTTTMPESDVRRYGFDIYDFEAWVPGDARYPDRFDGYVISRCLTTGGSVPIYTRQNDNMLVEYSAFYNTTTGIGVYNHGAGISAYETNHNFTMRYNKYQQIRGTSIFSFRGDNWKIYGNVIWDCSLGVEGVIAGFTKTYTSHNNSFYNNTIVDGQGFSKGIYFTPGSTGNVAYNNLWIGGITNIFFTAVTHDYNAYSEATDRGEAHQQLSVPTSIFTNYAGDGFTLASGTTAGVTLGSPYTTDMNGNIRGGDGTWDRGAYEYGGAPGPSYRKINGVTAAKINGIVSYTINGH